MTVLVTADEMQAAEQAVIESGISAGVLMRRAAEAIAAWVDRSIPSLVGIQREVLAFVGPGNNGGDALVALALLHERGWHAGAIFLGRDDVGVLPASDESLRAIRRVDIMEIGTPHAILDGVFGVRSRASLPTNVSDVFSVARKLRLTRSTPLIAIDIPSGIDADTGDAARDAFPADVTLCLGLPKRGLVLMPAAEFVGELTLLPIGIAAPDLPPERPRLLTEDIIRPLLPRRDAFAHKHDTGSVIIVGGAPTYYGAPRLATEAALRAGAGLVRAAVPNSIVPVIAAQVPEAVLIPLDDFSADTASSAIGQYLDGRSGGAPSVVIGPGLGRDDRARRLLDDFFSLVSNLEPDIQPPLVIDADALNWLSDQDDRLEGLPTAHAVLTPHSGELARLLKCSWEQVAANPLEFARGAARHYRQIVLLKRGYSIAAAPDGRAWYAPRATPELATAGTGDVLAGLIGGFVAQGLSSLDAALAAVWVGTHAGYNVRRKQGTVGVIAGDIIGLIPAAMAELTEPDLRH